MATSIHLKVVALAALVIAGSTAYSENMDIVKDGRAVAVIVAQRPGEGSARLESRTVPKRSPRGFECDDPGAAAVLVDWIEKISGATLPVVEQPSAGKPAIYIGAAAVKAGLDLGGIDSPTNEGLRIVGDGKLKILIGGQNGTSTMKAACRFLEELGCRFFMDNDLGQVYPRQSTITVGAMDIAEKPGLKMRKIWGSKWGGHNLWKVWNGVGGLQMATGHSWSRYVDQDLFETHPEYFALREGRRKKGGWYCTSNPELRKVFARGVIENGGPNPSVSPPDGTGYCQCKKCLAQDDPDTIEPSSGRVSVTNRYADFLDEVARLVGKEHSEHLLNFYCYADYTQPPTLDRRLSPNLVAWIAPIRYSRYHRIGSPVSPSRMQLAQVIDGWAAATEQIAYRTYNFNLAECLVPFSKLSVWKHDIPYLRDKGCIGINLESLVNWEIYGPHLYQSIRLAYDPDADSDAMLDDYFMKFYGSAAGPFMKQYWMSIDEAFANMKCESGSFFALHLVYTPQFLNKLSTLIRQAAANADNETYSARISMTAEGLKNAQQFIQIRNAMNQGDFAAAKKVYDDLYARNEVEMNKGYGNHYTLNYLRRFVGTHVQAGAEATATPNKVLQVLPDRMKLAYDRQDNGAEQGWHKSDFDDSRWRRVATYSNTLNAQGLPDTKSVMWYRTSMNVPRRREGRLALFFTEIDGQAATVYVNGVEVADLGREAKRKPFEVDVTKAAGPGDNTVAIRIDHSRITELFLGGIVRPILLIHKPG